MKYEVLIRKGVNIKKKECNSLEEAINFARWAAYLLDIKIIKTLRKKDWFMYGSKLCYFRYDITLKKYFYDTLDFVQIRSELLSKSLYGKDVKQIEKQINK